jgi:hypothetical protein
MMIAKTVHIPLCEYDDGRGPHTLCAVIDELTLTYEVLDRHGRRLERHLPTLQAARAWAQAYRDAQQRGP